MKKLLISTLFGLFVVLFILPSAHAQSAPTQLCSRAGLCDSFNNTVRRIDPPKAPPIKYSNSVDTSVNQGVFKGPSQADITRQNKVREDRARADADALKRLAESKQQQQQQTNLVTNSEKFTSTPSSSVPQNIDSSRALAGVDKMSPGWQKDRVIASVRKAERDAVTNNNLQKKENINKPLEKQAQDLVALNNNKHRVTLRSDKQQLEIDLAGKDHNGVPTPHTKVSPRNFQAPEHLQPKYNSSKDNSTVLSASQDDLRTARRYLERQQ